MSALQQKETKKNQLLLEQKYYLEENYRKCPVAIVFRE